jgi:hypothetical protein
LPKKEKKEIVFDSQSQLAPAKTNPSFLAQSHELTSSNPQFKI